MDDLEKKYSRTENTLVISTRIPIDLKVQLDVYCAERQLSLQSAITSAIELFIVR